MPPIEGIIAAQRKKLVAGEYGLVSRIGGAYKTAQAEATRRLNATASDFTKQRMSILLSGIENELNLAASKTIPLIKGHQAAVKIQAGKDLAEQLHGLDLSARLDPLANERMFAALSPESPLSQLLAHANMQGLTAARSALFTGVALGDNPLKIAPKLREALDIPRWRAQTIARTEVMRTYRGSVRERMRQADFGSWMWISAEDATTCAECWAMHGTIHPINDAFGSHPNCHCSQAPVASDGGLLGDINGEEDFAELDDAAQRNVLGGAKFKAYKDGVISLSDLVGVANHPQWGLIRYEKSLVSILGNAAAPYYKGGVAPSNFQKQLLKAHEMATAAAAAAAAEIAKAAQAQADALALEEAIKKAKLSAAAKKGAQTKAALAAEAKSLNVTVAELKKMSAPAKAMLKQRLLARGSRFHVDRVEGSTFYVTYLGAP